MVASLLSILKSDCHLVNIRGGTVTYEAWPSGFRFIVPLNEVGDSTILPTEKTVIFSKWIKPQYASMVEGVECQ